MYDFGYDAAAAATLFTWRIFCKFATAPPVDETVQVYWKSGDAALAHIDNDDGTGDAALSNTDKLKNLLLLGMIVIDENSATPEFSASGKFVLPDIQGAPVILNSTADLFSSTAADHGFDLTPTPHEIQ